MHLDDSLAALELVRRFEGPIVDVGSGGGAPGIPLAAALPEREVTLLESNRRKCDVSRADGPPSSRTCGSCAVGPRSSRSTPGAWRSRRRSLPPPVAAEWCLPLVSSGRSRDPVRRPERQGRARSSTVAGQLAAELADSPPGLLVLRKLRPDASGLPAPSRRRQKTSALTSLERSVEESPEQSLSLLGRGLLEESEDSRNDRVTTAPEQVAQSTAWVGDDVVCTAERLDGRPHVLVAGERVSRIELSMTRPEKIVSAVAPPAKTPGVQATARSTAVQPPPRGVQRPSRSRRPRSSLRTQRSAPLR